MTRSRRIWKKRGGGVKVPRKRSSKSKGDRTSSYLLKKEEEEEGRGVRKGGNAKRNSTKKILHSRGKRIVLRCISSSLRKTRKDLLLG